MLCENQPESVGRSATLTIPELEQSKAAVHRRIEQQARLVLGKSERGAFLTVNRRALDFGAGIFSA